MALNFESVIAAAEAVKAAKQKKKEEEEEEEEEEDEEKEARAVGGQGGRRGHPASRTGPVKAPTKHSVAATAAASSSRSLPLSGFRGVQRRSIGSWQARVTVGGKQVSVGSFRFPEEAAAAHDTAVRNHRYACSLSEPPLRKCNRCLVPDIPSILFALPRRRPGRTSAFPNFSSDKLAKEAVKAAHSRVTDEEAIRANSARAKAVAGADQKKVPPPASGFYGVYQRSTCSWQAKVTHHGKQVHVGSFSTPEEAAAAQDTAVRNHRYALAF